MSHRTTGVKQYFSAKRITMLAVFSAMSALMYIFTKFSLPMLFPGFLELQFSDMPALLAGYSMGPVAGAVVIIVRALIKLPLTSTGFVGELADLIIGLSFVLPSAALYKRFRTKRGAVLSLCAGAVCTVGVAIVLNWLVLIPFYAKLYGFEMVLGALQAVIKGATKETFYLYYLCLSVLPFNILRSAVSAILTFVIYKKVERVFDRLFNSDRRTRLNTVPKPPTVATSATELQECSGSDNENLSS